MADIFGRHNSPLEKAGDNLVTQVKEQHKARKAYSRKEIAQAVKDSPLNFLNKKPVSVQMLPSITQRRWDAIFKARPQKKADKPTGHRFKTKGKTHARQ